jgi:hypothetical protein
VSEKRTLQTTMKEKESNFEDKSEAGIQSGPRVVLAKFCAVICFVDTS